MNLANKTILITGAARGIGAAAAARLHSLGANVSLVGLEPDRLAANVERLGHERAAFFEADVTDYEALQSTVAATVERFGKVDVAIANAGIAFTGTLAGAPVEHVERTLAVNLLGVWRTDRAVLPELERSRGYLLNIASLAAVAHAPMMGPYTAAKAGVEALSDALRLECAPKGVAVGCAYFGFLDTDLVKATFNRENSERAREALPAFLANPAPLAKGIDAIEKGIERRSARIWAPRWVGPMIALRGLLQPLTERRALSDMAQLSESVRLAEEAAGSEDQDPILGVAAAALQQDTAGAGAATPRG